ncbi:MAG: hypothetical protein K9I82_02385 [Chitinophagaceae bacterium]|jgi:hypothetical protein|nr:hypothetical protein [Chitinophagaceae bacterium]
MAFTQTEKKEIEVIIRKEMKDFFDSNTISQYETKLIEKLQKEFRRGKFEGEVKDITIKLFREFYQFMWTNRGYWEPKLKNA